MLGAAQAERPPHLARILLNSRSVTLFSYLEKTRTFAGGREMRGAQVAREAAEPLEPMHRFLQRNRGVKPKERAAQEECATKITRVGLGHSAQRQGVEFLVARAQSTHEAGS